MSRRTEMLREIFDEAYEHDIMLIAEFAYQQGVECRGWDETRREILKLLWKNKDDNHHTH
jgi:hypothetical protein